jgi:hypothetical protein
VEALSYIEDKRSEHGLIHEISSSIEVPFVFLSLNMSNISLLDPRCSPLTTDQNSCHQSSYLGIRASQSAVRDRALGKVLIVRENLADFGLAKFNALPDGSSRAIGENDSRGESSEGHIVAVTAAVVALLEILDDELGTGLEEGARSLILEVFGDLLPSRQVL